jgi:alpha-tubulin suppressor-like RCC1 family protein
VKIKYFEEKGIFITKISAGHSHCLALDSEGKVYEWGLCKIKEEGGNFMAIKNRFDEIINEVGINIEFEALDKPR